jgi:hypothetical protein
VIGRSDILTYKEDAFALERSLNQEDLNPTILRASYNETELKYTRNVRTFMNHFDGWKRAQQYDDYTLICESDFVPRIGLGEMPAFWPLWYEFAWGSLY